MNVAQGNAPTFGVIPGLVPGIQGNTIIGANLLWIPRMRFRLPWDDARKNVHTKKAWRGVCPALILSVIGRIRAALAD